MLERDPTSFSHSERVLQAPLEGVLPPTAFFDSQSRIPAAQSAESGQAKCQSTEMGDPDKVRRRSLRKAACVAIERRSVTLGDSPGRSSPSPSELSRSKADVDNVDDRFVRHTKDRQVSFGSVRGHIALASFVAPSQLIARHNYRIGRSSFGVGPRRVDGRDKRGDCRGQGLRNKSRA
jgi:hypothetical protein